MKGISLHFRRQAPWIAAAKARAVENRGPMGSSGERIVKDISRRVGRKRPGVTPDDTVIWQAQAVAQKNGEQFNPHESDLP